jgi:hypothetical protein
MKKCSVCGSSNTDGALFCSNCGTSLAASQSSQLAQPVGGATKPVPVVKTITPLAQKAPPEERAQFVQTTPQFPMPAARTQVTAGSCFYHPELPSTYICARCGRPICLSCTRTYGQLAICTECHWALGQRAGAAP